MLDSQLGYDPETLRWVCTCGRTSPRHPATRTRDMNPVRHSNPDGLGECCGAYRAQKLIPSGDRSTWVDDTEVSS